MSQMLLVILKVSTTTISMYINVCEIKLVEKTKESLPMKHEKGNIHDEYSQVITARCPLASSRNKTDQ